MRMGLSLSNRLWDSDKTINLTPVYDKYYQYTTICIEIKKT